MERTTDRIRPEIDNAVPGIVSRSSGDRSVFVRGRSLPQPPSELPRGLLRNRRIKSDGIAFLSKLESEKFPLVFFDPQYRGVLDHQAYGNEGARQRARSTLRQMTDQEIAKFFREIERVLMPSGHLLLWTDKFHLCMGMQPWFKDTQLEIVDLLVWNKQRMGMGYRTRRVSEYLAVLQKTPRRAKGVWAAHDIPDVWDEKMTKAGPHAKPIGLQAKLIESLTNPGDTVIDPASGSFSVLESCKRSGRNFLGCDING